MKKFDYLVVGGGLAGSVFSFLALLRAKTVFMLNEPSKYGYSASQISLGTYSPITGRHNAKTWKIKELMSCLYDTFAQAKDRYNSDFLFPRNVLLPIDDTEKQNTWQAALSNPYYEGYLKQVSSELYHDFLKKSLEQIEIGESGYVDIKHFITCLRSELAQQGHYLEHKWYKEDTHFFEDKVIWKDISARHLVMCQGYRAMKEGYFTDLPFTPNKGEVLHIKMCKPHHAKHMIKKNVQLIPKGIQNFTVGSTYGKDIDNLDVTKKALNFLNERISNMVSEPYEVLEQKAAIRPSTKDRYPLIGQHPSLAQCYILNGLGSKGVVFAPYLANQLLDFIEHGHKLDPQIDLKRFLS